MQHISQLTTAQSAKSEQPTTAHDNARLLSDEQMRQLWERMGMMYGHRWKANFGLADDGTWKKGLAGLTPKQIGDGLVKCLERRPRDGDEDWPPTLSEFRAMCLPPVINPIHRDFVALPKPIVDPKTIEDSIAKMRSLLGAP